MAGGLEGAWFAIFIFLYFRMFWCIMNYYVVFFLSFGGWGREDVWFGTISNIMI